MPAFKPALVIVNLSAILLALERGGNGLAWRRAANETRRHRGSGMHQRRIAGLIGAVLGILESTASVVAESSTDFFTGRQITMIVPSGVGGGYDLYGRFLARFIGKHV